MNARAVKIAAQMYEARDTLKRLVGDKFRERIEPWQAVIREHAKKTGKDELHVVMDLMQDMQKQGVTNGQLGLLAAYVEMVEPSDMPTTTKTAEVAAPVIVPQAVVPVGLDDLIVDHDSRRCIDHDRLEAVEESIRQVGLLQPVLVRKMAGKGHSLWKLVAGAHRVEACRRLGWDSIPAIVQQMDDLHAELAEIDENLVRSPLSALEESQAIARRKEIYEQLHPETKRGAKGGRKKAEADTETRRHGDTEQGEGLRVRKDQVGPEGHGRELDCAAQSNSPPPLTPTKSFIEDTADKTGQDPGTISRKAKIGREILPDVAKKIAKTAVADNAKELAKLAKLEPEEQRAVAALLADGEVQSVTEALAEPPGPGDPVEKPSKRRTSRTEPGVTDSASAVPATDNGKPVTVAQHLIDLASGRVKRGTLNERVPLSTGTASGPQAPDEPQGAGAWLRERVGWLLAQWRAAYPDDATSVLAAAVLEQIAAEQREGFLDTVAQADTADPYIEPIAEEAHAKTPSRKGKKG